MGERRTWMGKKRQLDEVIMSICTIEQTRVLKKFKSEHYSDYDGFIVQIGYSSSSGPELGGDLETAGAGRSAL